MNGNQSVQRLALELMRLETVHCLPPPENPDGVVQATKAMFSLIRKNKHVRIARPFISELLIAQS